MLVTNPPHPLTLCVAGEPMTLACQNCAGPAGAVLVALLLRHDAATSLERGVGGEGHALVAGTTFDSLVEGRLRAVGW